MQRATVLVYGSGGHGRVILDILNRTGQYDVRGVIDDDPGKVGSEINGYRIIGAWQDVLRLRRDIPAAIVLAIGDNYIRARLFDQCRQQDFRNPVVIDPTAVVSPSAKLGKGVIIFPGAIVQANAVLGDNVCINTRAVVEHDCRIHDHVQLYPGAVVTGGVCVKEYSFIGTQASVNPYLTIGAGVFVGAGVTVTKDIPDEVTVYGFKSHFQRRKDLPPHPNTGKNDYTGQSGK